MQYPTAMAALMGRTPNPHQREVAVDLLERFPETPTQTLAKKAFKENPSMWNSLDSCRRYFRAMRGNASPRQLKSLQDRRFVRPSGERGVFGKLPEPKRDINDWSPVVFDGPMHILNLSDIHIPYYDKTALICALEFGLRVGTDTILLNGDICDFYSISAWETDPRKRRFAEELRAVQDFFITLREEFPKARIVFKTGNHEDRLERYMWVKAPELLDVPAMAIEELLKLNDYDIQIVKDMRPMMFGKLNVIHGHEYRFAISNPVNPARGLFLRSKTNSLCGHFHQTSQHSEGTLELHTISTWSSGCLSDLHPRFRPLNNWNHGFSVIEVDKEGSFDVRNLRVIHGKAY